MSEPWQIVLFIIVVLIVVYIAWLFFVLACVANFKNRLSKRLLAISVSMSEKKEVMLQMADFLKTNNATFSDGDTSAISLLRATSIGQLKEEDVPSINAILKEAKTHLNFVASTNGQLSKEDTYQTYMHSLNDIDANYRAIVAIYNSDVAGYNYWITSLLTRLFFIVFNTKKKETLN